MAPAARGPDRLIASLTSENRPTKASAASTSCRSGVKPPTYAFDEDDLGAIADGPPTSYTRQR